MRAADLEISHEGLRAIAEEEGYRAEPYVCPAGRLTIGYGHVIRPGEALEHLSPDEALELLRADARTAEDAIRRLVRVPLAQHEYDALVSLVLNIGGARFARSELLGALNAGDRAGAVREWAEFRWGAGKILPVLVARRGREIARFLGHALTWTEVQRQLAAAGLYEGALDGLPGPATLRAVAALLARGAAR
jgi:lysozyme